MPIKYTQQDVTTLLRDGIDAAIYAEKSGDDGDAWVAAVVLGFAAQGAHNIGNQWHAAIAKGWLTALKPSVGTSSLSQAGAVFSPGPEPPRPSAEPWAKPGTPRLTA